MNTLSRSSAACAVVLAIIATIHPAPLAAQQEVVVELPTVARWSAAISRELDDSLVYPRAMHGRELPEGTAWVDFTCSDSGQPAGMKIAQRSGSPMLDRAALAAVQRIKTMHPLPAGIGHDQRDRAVIMFALSESSLREQRRAMLRDPRLNGRASNGVLALVAPGAVMAR